MNCNKLNIIAIQFNYFINSEVCSLKWIAVLEKCVWAFSGVNRNIRPSY